MTDERNPSDEPCFLDEFIAENMRDPEFAAAYRRAQAAHSDDVREFLLSNTPLAVIVDRLLDALSAVGFVVLRVPQGTGIEHGDALEPTLGDTQQLWDFFGEDYEQWLPTYVARRPVPKPATNPCEHSRPVAIDDYEACPDCGRTSFSPLGGSGVATTEGEN